MGPIQITQRHHMTWIITTAVYMFSLLMFSLIPVRDLQGVSSVKQIMHNVAHVPAYAILTLLLIGALGSKLRVRAFWISILYGCFNEIVQSFVPGRSCSIVDVCSNALGAGISIYFISKRFIRFGYPNEDQ